MNRMLVLALGLGARALSLVSGLLSDWIFAKLADGAVIGYEIASDACEFGEWLIAALAHYVSGSGQIEPSYSY
jgi:hypothetical protein